MQEETGREYRITAAGAKALQAQHSLPSWYRLVLERITCGENTAAALCRSVTVHLPHRVLAWLDELETLGFVEALPSGLTFFAKYGPYREKLLDSESILEEFQTLRV
jgi:hypothetical protein